MFVSPTPGRERQPENFKAPHHRHWGCDLRAIDQLFFQRNFSVQVHLSVVTPTILKSI